MILYGGLIAAAVPAARPEMSDHERSQAALARMDLWLDLREARTKLNKVCVSRSRAALFIIVSLSLVVCHTVVVKVLCSQWLLGVSI